MMVLVLNVSTKAKGTSNISSSNGSTSGLLQIEDRINGNSQQEDIVDIGLFPRELKNNFSAVVKSRFQISSANCLLLDSPPTVVLRNYERSLPDTKTLADFMCLVMRFLKQNNYLKSDYHVTVGKILRDQNITEFFFDYYEKARSELQNIISSESSAQHSIYQGNVPVKYLLYTFYLEDQTILDAALSSFFSDNEAVLDRILLCCQRLRCYFLFIKVITAESDKMAIDLANHTHSLPYSVSSTPTEVNEQLFPLFAIDVSIDFLLTL
jgi:hypothetical protein